jgi:hypothetical protein
MHHCLPSDLFPLTTPCTIVYLVTFPIDYLTHHSKLSFRILALAKTYRSRTSSACVCNMGRNQAEEYTRRRCSNHWLFFNVCNELASVRRSARGALIWRCRRLRRLCWRDSFHERTSQTSSSAMTFMIHPFMLRRQKIHPFMLRRQKSSFSEY